MPECKFGLNDRQLVESEKKTSTYRATSNPSKSIVELDDCQFHQCVRLGNFEESKTINFIPPDGEFELMKYRSTENIQLPFKVRAIVNEVSNSRVEYKLLLKAQFPAQVFAQSLVLRIPTPTNTASAKISVTGGKAKYVGSDHCLVWKYGFF